MQHWRACVGFRLGSIATINGCGIGHIRGRRKTTLQLQARCLGAVLPTICITVIKHRTDDEAFVRHGIGDNTNIHSGLIGDNCPVILHHSSIGVNATRANASTHTQQVRDSGRFPLINIDLIDANRLGANQTTRAILICNSQGTAHIREAFWRGILQCCIGDIA